MEKPVYQIKALMIQSSLEHTPPHTPSTPYTQRCVFTNCLGIPLSNQIDNEDQPTQMVNCNTL